MYITEIELSDLRCYKGTQTLSLDRGDGRYAGWTVFAGRNGSGKSTLLKALALSVIGPMAARSLVGTFPGWVRRQTESARVFVRLMIDKDKDVFFKNVGVAQRRMRVGLEWVPRRSASDQIGPWLGENPEDAMRRHEKANMGPWSESPMGWFIAGYGPYRHLGPVTVEMLQKSANPVLARLINLFSETATLSESVDWLKQVHTRALEQKPGAAMLRDAVLQFLADGLLPDGSTVQGVDSDGLWILRDGVRLPLEQVSDGYRTTAALVVDLLRHLHSTYGDLQLVEGEGHRVCPLPGVVLIDEVDTHMHVSWQQKIGFWLTSRFPNIQFLVTTHSPFVCQAASPRGLIRLPAPGEEGGMRHIEDRLFNAIVNGSADDAVLSDLFGLEHAHSGPAEQLRNEVVALENKVLDGQASDMELARYRTLKRKLPDDLGELADLSVRALFARGTLS